MISFGSLIVDASFYLPMNDLCYCLHDWYNSFEMYLIIDIFSKL